MWEPFFLKGMLSAHSAAVTAISTPIDNGDMMVSSSRDKSIVVWDLTKSRLPNYQDLPSVVGLPRRRLTGHSHFIQDVVLSFDGQFALSGSWDGELRLWDLEKGCTTRRFVGHTNSVLSVAFSFDNRLIVSGSRDKTIKLWNTIGSCKYTIQNDLDGGGHTNWVSSVRFIPNAQPTIVSGSWDRTVKVWNLTNCKLQSTMTDHAGYVNAVTVSPDGSVCASGGRDDEALLWDINGGKKMYSLNTNTIIHAVCFCPNRYWLCTATQHGVLIWDLDNRAIVQDIKLETPTTNRKGTSKKPAQGPTSLKPIKNAKRRAKEDEMDSDRHLVAMLGPSKKKYKVATNGPTIQGASRRAASSSSTKINPKRQPSFLFGVSSSTSPTFFI